LQVLAADFRTEALPAHLVMRLRLVAPDGRFIAESRSLGALRAEHGERAQGAFQSALADVASRLREATPPESAGSGTARSGPSHPGAGRASTARADEGRRDGAPSTHAGVPGSPGS